MHRMRQAQPERRRVVPRGGFRAGAKAPAWRPSTRDQMEEARRVQSDFGCRWLDGRPPSPSTESRAPRELDACAAYSWPFARPTPWQAAQLEGVNYDSGAGEGGSGGGDGGGDGGEGGGRRRPPPRSRTPATLDYSSSLRQNGTEPLAARRDVLSLTRPLTVDWTSAGRPRCGHAAAAPSTAGGFRGRAAMSYVLHDALLPPSALLFSLPEDQRRDRLQMDAERRRGAFELRRKARVERGRRGAARLAAAQMFQVVEEEEKKAPPRHRTLRGALHMSSRLIGRAKAARRLPEAAAQAPGGKGAWLKARGVMFAVKKKKAPEPAAVEQRGPLLPRLQEVEIALLGEPNDSWSVAHRLVALEELVFGASDADHHQRLNDIEDAVWG